MPACSNTQLTFYLLACLQQHPAEVVEFYFSRGLQAFVGALRRCPFCTLQPNADWSLLALEDGMSPQRELQHVRQLCRTMAFGQVSSRLYNWDKKAARPSEGRRADKWVMC